MAPEGGTTTVDGGSAPPRVATSQGATDVIDAPEAMAFDREGNLFVSDCPAHRIWMIDAAGDVSLVAGIEASGLNGGFSGDGGPAIDAGLGCPAGLAFDPEGDLVFADHANDRIRMIDPAGIITTIAGHGPAGVDAGGYTGDGGPATAARLSEPIGIAFDGAGNLFFTDRDNHVIRMIDRRGIITTIAGTGEAGSDGDGGPAIDAELDQPYYLIVERDGTIIVADSGAACVRKIDPDGTIMTIAGTGEPGFSGDGGPATDARMIEPYGLAVDDAGDLYVSERNRVRMIDPNGTIMTIAGTGEPGFSGDGGPAIAARIEPYGLAIDGGGDLYIADGGNGRVRVVDRQGVIRTISPA
jgi:DNA-binding beta-propeller fold protein YncE